MSLHSNEPSESLTSASLLVRVRDRSSDAWAELVDLYAPLVANWCRRRGLKEADAADVIQEVFLNVANSLHRFEHRPGQAGSFRSWLWSITRRRIVDWFRARGECPAVGGSSHLERLNAQHRGLNDAQDVIASDEEALDEPTSALDLDELKRRALQQIEGKVAPQTWQAFWRCVVDGQPTERVAEELGLSAASVRQARSRILRRLREQLGDC